jgi:hypothetical protein
MHAPVYAGLGSRVGRLPNLLQEMREYVRRRALLETAYARPSRATQRRPKSTTRTARFLDEQYGADGKSKRRLDWKQSSVWHYWIEGCLANSSTRFRKFFRITRSRFDEIYLAAADSGEFRLNPAEPLFARAFPEIPPGKHGAQLQGLSALFENRCLSPPPSHRRAIRVSMTLDSAAGSGVLSVCLPRSLCMLHFHSICYELFLLLCVYYI